MDKKQSGFFLGKVCLIEEVWFLMVRVRCEPICGIWRYMLQAWHNKLEACRTLMGKVAGCKLRCVVDYTYLSLLPSFLPTFFTCFLRLLIFCFPPLPHPRLQNTLMPRSTTTMKRADQTLHLSLRHTAFLFLFHSFGVRNRTHFVPQFSSKKEFCEIYRA